MNGRLDGKSLQSNDVIGRACRSDLAPSCSMSPPLAMNSLSRTSFLWGRLGCLVREALPRHIRAAEIQPGAYTWRGRTTSACPRGSSRTPQPLGLDCSVNTPNRCPPVTMEG